MSARLLLRQPTTLRGVSLLPIRSLSSTPARLLKESNNPNPSASDYDKHKQDSLAKQKAGKGHWKPELASESEESVKADRMSPEEAGAEAVKRLQERTKGVAEETAKHGTSMKDHM